MKRLIAFILLCFFIFSLKAQQLVAHYPFNLSTQDNSVNHINPTYVGPFIDYDEDRFGKDYGALKFDGNAGSYLRMPADSLPTGNRTVSLWFKASSVANRPQLLSYGGNSPSAPPGTSFLMGINTGGSGTYLTQAHYGTNQAIWTYPQEPVNTWTHWVVTIEGNTTALYINGKLQTSAPGTFTSPTVVSGKDFALGVMVNSNGIAPYTDVNGGYFQGLMDDVRIYRGAMTEAQVKQLFNLESTGLVAYYPFNGNASDESGNGKNGIVNGATLTTDRFNNPDRAYRFTSPNHIRVPNSNLFGDEFTLSYWYRIGSYFGQRGVLSNVSEPNGGFQQTSDGQALTYMLGYNFTGGFSPNFFSAGYPMQEPVNQWHHLVLTYERLGTSASRTQLFIDGELKRTNVHPMPLAYTPNAPFFIGQNHSGINFEGDLDEVRVYNRILKSNEIRQLADGPMMPDLLAWIPMNGNALDVSGNQRHGSVYGAMVPTGDRYGNNASAYRVEGADAGITLANSQSLDFVGKPFSISIWVKYNEVTTPPYALVAKHSCGIVNGYLLGIYENIPRFFLASGSNWSMIGANRPYHDGQWHHIVATFDGNQSQNLYVDGQWQSSATVTYNNPSGAGIPVIIGDAAGSCGGGNFVSVVDECRLYGGALDSMQVKALFLQSRGSGNALSFLESSQTRVELDSTLIGDEFSAEAWVKTPGFEGPQFVIRGSGPGTWAFGMQNEKLILRKSGQSVQASSTVPVYNNAWHHVAVTVKNNSFRFYFDGMQVGSGDLSPAATQKGAYAIGESLNGLFDEIRIWKKELSLEHIRLWMNRKITTGHPAYADFQHYFNFDEPHLSKTYDSRGSLSCRFIHDPQYGPSGAPLGDTSVVSFDLPNTQGVELVLQGSDSLKISGWNGSPNGVAVYAVLDAPANARGISGLGGNDHYFGTVGYGSFNGLFQRYKYGNNPMVSPFVQPTLALYYRQSNASPQWGPGTEVSHNPVIRQFFSQGPAGEWILGSTGTPLQTVDLNGSGTPAGWAVYPNPAREALYFKGLGAQAMLTIRDATGRVVLGPVKPGPDRGVQVSALKEGLYFLQVQEGGKRWVSKILIRPN